MAARGGCARLQGSEHPEEREDDHLHACMHPGVTCPHLHPEEREDDHEEDHEREQVDDVFDGRRERRDNLAQPGDHPQQPEQPEQPEGFEAREHRSAGILVNVEAVDEPHLHEGSEDDEAVEAVGGHPDVTLAAEAKKLDPHLEGKESREDEVCNLLEGVRHLRAPPNRRA